MVRGVLTEVSDHLLPHTASDNPPMMFARPSDVPGFLPSVRHGDQVTTLHREWIRVAASGGQGLSRPRRIVRRVRRMFSGSGDGVDQAMIADLIRAIDAVAARCDEMSERLTTQNIVVDDVVTIYSEELTRLRVDLAQITHGLATRPPSTTAPDE